MEAVAEFIKAFNPNQPRDAHGRFGEVAHAAAAAVSALAGSAGGAATVAHALANVVKPVKLDLSKFADFSPKPSQKSAFQLHLRKWAKQWLKVPLTNREEHYIASYTQHSGLNVYLRHGGLSNVDNEDLVQQNKHLNFAIAKSFVPQDLKLFRGTTRAFLKQLRSAKFDDVLIDKGFVSTSFSKRTANNFAIEKDGALAHIYVAKGKNALIADGNSSHESETEAILPKNSRFRFLHFDKNTDEAHLELL